MDEQRDEKTGRWLPGNPGGPGRAKGSENRFTELKRDVLTAYATAEQDGELCGLSFWRDVKRTRPALFARLLVQLLPRELQREEEAERAEALFGAL